MHFFNFNQKVFELGEDSTLGLLTWGLAGMEKPRSHRLQQIIVDECASYECDFQLIYATSDINPEFAQSNMVVGRFYTPEARSLDVREV